MQVKELIEKLKTMPDNAYVVIGNEVVHGIELHKGQLEIGHFNPIFKAGKKGNDKAIYFLLNVEMSDGTIVSEGK